MRLEPVTPLDGSQLKRYYGIIGQNVTVVMDRPVGARHPKHPDIIYPINYGYIEGLLGGDGEEQDVYVLGESKPLSRFEGKVIAIVHRFDDDECKWVAAKDGESYSPAEINNAVRFQEQFHDGTLVM